MKRPDGVTAIAVWYFVEAFFTLMIACTLIAVPLFGEVFSEIRDSTGAFWVTFGITCAVVFVLLQAIALLLAGWGLVRMWQWARWLAFILAIFGLFAFPIGTVIGALIIWYLLKDEVREAFDAAEDGMMLAAVPPVDEVEST